MRLIIKGMSLPKHAAVNGEKDTAYKCVILAHADNSVELVIDTEFASQYDNGHNIQRYPITEIPTPHGRLIDADRLKEMIEQYHCNGCDNYNGARCSACWVDDCFTYIDDTPTIIEAEHESEAQKWARVGRDISKGLQEGIEAIHSEGIEE